MAQIARPDSDVSAGGWTPSTGATLFGVIDEAVASDADYASSATAPSADECEVGLSNVTDPGLSSGHIVRYRIRKNTAGGSRIDATAKLKQGAAVIASWSHTDKDENWTTYEQTLAGAEADAISDYTDLRLAMSANQV